MWYVASYVAKFHRFQLLKLQQLELVIMCNFFWEYKNEDPHAKRSIVSMVTMYIKYLKSSARKCKHRARNPEYPYVDFWDDSITVRPCPLHT